MPKRLDRRERRNLEFCPPLKPSEIYAEDQVDRRGFDKRLVAA